MCHRLGDREPENLLVDARTLEISDFGLSAVYKQKETGKARLLNERCGSLPYIALEVCGYLSCPDEHAHRNYSGS